ncbi:hypothetical protein [Patiriisocius sp. Uisw_017]|jgi:Ni,Fe-hydrogenase III small subunit|uniref:hypothetical protein n=1 Tax=Patiriisocius sp. Uisw_017 TaxID=3230968 RepID=UPI0039EC73B5
MKISGTVHLSEASNDRLQFIYGSMYNNQFVGLYGNFTVKNGILKKLSLFAINYSKQKNCLIKNASLNNFHMEHGNDVRTIRSEAVDINCLTLTVEIVENLDKPDYDIDNLNIKLQANSFLRVLRETDDGTRTNEVKNQFTTECVAVIDNKEGLAAPGYICPRGYSKIIL